MTRMNLACYGSFIFAATTAVGLMLAGVDPARRPLLAEVVRTSTAAPAISQGAISTLPILTAAPVPAPPTPVVLTPLPAAAPARVARVDETADVPAASGADRPAERGPERASPLTAEASPPLPPSRTILTKTPPKPVSRALAAVPPAPSDVDGFPSAGPGVNGKDAGVRMFNGGDSAVSGRSTATSRVTQARQASGRAAGRAIKQGGLFGWLFGSGETPPAPDVRRGSKVASVSLDAGPPASPGR